MLSGVAFLPRDVLFKRGLCRHAVSVSLSRSYILSKRVGLLTSSDFFHRPPEASNTKGYKNHDFRLISRFISKLMQDRAIVTTEGK